MTQHDNGRPALIERLLDPAAYPHPVHGLACVETHISWVLLSGEYAYKIKKPVALGFLDFSTLALRRAACADELRLNRRFAAPLYLDVVPIAGPAARASVCGAGEAIEYAVRMRQFDQHDQFDRLLEAGRLGAGDIALAAQRIAQFHDAAPPARDDDSGTAPSIAESVAATLRSLEPLVPVEARADFAAVSAWCHAQATLLAAEFDARHARGCVRECHGDLHLGNIVRYGGDVVPFDCIEFNARLRRIDVISDVAFLVMDLLYRDAPALAWRLLNDYLEARGDYGGVAVLRYYLVYRAVVRALVALLRCGQLHGDAAAIAARDGVAHLALAGRIAAPDPPVLLLMHGLSGSGKTHVSGELMARWPAVRVRSDVERKRLLGLAANASTRSAAGAGAYDAQSTAATYRRLGEVAATALRAGFSAIVDAASLRRDERDRLRAIARALGARCVVVSCHAEEAELRRRIARRIAQGADASEADGRVLDLQLSVAAPLDQDETSGTVVAGPECDADTLVGRIAARLTRA